MPTPAIVQRDTKQIMQQQTLHNDESKTKKKLQGLKIRATIFEGILNIFWPNNNKNKSKQIADANKVQIQNLNEDWIWNTQQERINSEGHGI